MHSMSTKQILDILGLVTNLLGVYRQHSSVHSTPIGEVLKNLSNFTVLLNERLMTLPDIDLGGKSSTPNDDPLGMSSVSVGSDSPRQDPT